MNVSLQLKNFLALTLLLILAIGCATASPTSEQVDVTQPPQIEEVQEGNATTMADENQNETLAPAPVARVFAPQGSPPTIDGMLSPGEWDAANVETFADGSELLLMHADGYLYLGIRANEPGMIAANIFLQRGDEISILHASAALGTALYQRGADSWQQTQDFDWQCRSTSLSDAAQAERVAFLQGEGWVAANGRMGTPNELEYQIKILEQDFRLAAAYIKAAPPYEKAPWPPQLTDDTIMPTPDGLPSEMQFAPELWMTIIKEKEPNGI